MSLPNTSTDEDSTRVSPVPYSSGDEPTKKSLTPERKISSDAPPVRQSSTDSTGRTPAKKSDKDFKFLRVLGEGSFSTVFLAREISNGREFAIKVVEKRVVIREKKTQYVQREKMVLNKIVHPFFVKLYFTFQDPSRLYFGLSYAKGGELLDYIKKLGSFDEAGTRFYSAEIVLALEYLDSIGIVHRDLKPENILLGEDMHIQITDFGSARVLDTDDNVVVGPQPPSKPEAGDPASRPRRRNSFVGTAQYVSPEVLKGQPAYSSADIWALGCIIYQLLSGSPPFRGSHEYEIFQKIGRLDYEFPEGFLPVAQDLVKSLLVLDPKGRLGCPELGGFQALKSHTFYQSVYWDNLPKSEPPHLLPYLPATNCSTENLYSDYQAGLDDTQITRLLGLELHNTPSTEKNDKPCLCVETDEERKIRLEKQTRENEYHRFVENNLVLKQGLVEKRRGLFARRRMLLLTEGPHLYYVDPQNMVLKGEIPWSSELRPEAKNFKIFFVHTPNRTYFLEDQSGYALDWVKAIQEVWEHYYDNKTAGTTTEVTSEKV